MRSEHCQEMFRELGQSWEPSADRFKKLQAFNAKCAHIIHDNRTTVDINTACHQLFCARREELESTRLPPYRNCLFMHIQCALTTRLASGDAVSDNIRKSQAQSSVAGSEMTMTSSPWNGCVDIQAPDRVLQLFSCKCSRRWKPPECQCTSNGSTCTNLCKLQTCDNQPQETR